MMTSRKLYVRRLTCDALDLAATLATRNEDDIALACIDVIVLENEKLLNAVFLKCRDLDYDADGTHETAVEDDILLAPDLDEQ